MKRKIKKKIKLLYKHMMVSLFSFLGKLGKKFVSYAYKKLFWAEWQIIDSPENFDHEIDLYYQWDKSCIPHWVERGVYNVQALKMFDSPIVLELCCGDGFNTKHFYSTSSRKIYSVDFDENIIEVAKKKNSMSNIEYKVQDIRDDFDHFFDYDGNITNIIWDAAIEHFTPTEIDNLMKSIKKTLSSSKGIVSGMTIVEKSTGKSLSQHEYEFKNKEDLKRFFTPYFENILVFETIYADRHNLYFYASDGDIPFTANWIHKV